MATSEELYARLVNLGLSYVSLRPRSKKELSDYLLEKNKKFQGDTAIVDAAFKRLLELGYGDDAGFAAWVISSRQKTNLKGRRFIERELQQKGVPKEIIEHAFIASPELLSEYDVAKKAVQKKAESWRVLPVETRKKRLYGYLARRGFSSSVVYRVIDELMKNEYNKGAKDSL